MSRQGTAAVCIWLVAALSLGCDARARHKTLTTFFDGVPPLKDDSIPAAPRPGAAGARQPSRQVGYREHGPYAAKLCNACHLPAATNALVAPSDELCFRCHELKQDFKYIHGPLASGGCLVCHDPHGSQYRFLLVSDSDSFCLRCHDRAAMERIEGHDNPEANCTGCHDAHGSDKKYLLK